MSARRLKLIYLYTTFPKSTETFLQREMAALLERGIEVRLYSLWGGGGEFEGQRVRTFNKWRLLELFWVIPWVAVTKTAFMGTILKGLFTRRPPSWINFWENMLGAGFAGVFRGEIASEKPDLVHAAWAGGPATAAWCLRQLTGIPYSAAAHAYDIYEHGGDWWLCEKLAEARFVHTSTDMGRTSLIARGVEPSKVHVIRRGLVTRPPVKPLRPNRRPLRILCVARLVEKKGLLAQLAIYAHARTKGLPFEARIVGEGPMRGALESECDRLGLTDRVRLEGALPQTDVWRHYDWADVLVHTGVVARSGDRDGLPNVIPEAMAGGVSVITTPTAGTTEAIEAGVTGWVVGIEDLGGWVEAFEAVASDDATVDARRERARDWVEKEFDARRNAARLHTLFLSAIAQGGRV